MSPKQKKQEKTQICHQKHYWTMACLMWFWGFIIIRPSLLVNWMQRNEMGISFLRSFILSLVISYKSKISSIGMFSSDPQWCTPTFLERFKCKSKIGNNGRRSWGTLFNLQHFEAKGVCRNSKMGTRTNDKRINYSHQLVQTKQQVD